jgi:prolipoprotein diacylglyceryltransferase/protein-S-isoprenylcysteine O-methyltransferase Ste14
MAVSSFGKWLYGAIFVLFVPIALTAWAMATADTVRIPPIVSPTFGLMIATAGGFLLTMGMANLWVYGGGLPMNAYPPPRYVAQGIFLLLPHPIYTGFTMLCVGVSVTVGSASGLWLVSPIVALSCAALVLGYERHDLRERFGRASMSLLPAAGPTSPSTSERLACYAFVLLPWVVLYKGVVALGTPPDAIAAWLAFERSLPVLEWSEIFYASAYFFIGLAPLLARTRDDLRTFSVRGLWAMTLAVPLLLAVPLTAPPRPFTPNTMLGHWLACERMLDGPATGFPSFRVIWTMLAAEVYARRWPRGAWWPLGWALLISGSCVTTGQNALVNVLAGFAIVGVVTRGAAFWEAIRSGAERIANSWREWRIGSVRIINHGIYVGLGGTFGLWIAGSLVGSEHQTAVLVAGFAAVVGAALWAQYIEGSSQLLRPFGYYGGLLGGILGALVAPLFGASAWLILAAFSAGGPWAQAMGRLRCLVQGCCHGRLAPDSLGIRYTHPRSRVCRLTAWAGLPLHPTPVYSILWNGFVASAIARLWILHAPLHLISGIYFILTGLGRFVEEAWRGEPQTPVFARLRLYQWAAVASVVAGALMTALGHGGPAPTPHFEWRVLLASAVFGAFVWFAMGVDFPNSSRRFSRLV